MLFDGQPYRVIGVLQPRPKALGAAGDDAQAFVALGPLAPERADLAADLRATSAGHAELAADQVRQALRGCGTCAQWTDDFVLAAM